VGLEDLAERLERIERLLRELLERVERLEAVTGLQMEEARVALELAALAVPLGEAAARLPRVLAAVAAAGRVSHGDPIARAIVEALAVKGPLSLRGLEREVRRIRGRASRAAIRARLRMLEEYGVVRVEKTGRGLRIRLAVPEGSPESPGDTGGAGGGGG